MSLRVRGIPTPVGPGRAHVHRPPAGPAAHRGSLVLGHGAGGGVGSADLQALTALTAQGWCVALLEQPWRVAGRRVATPPATLDVATDSLLRALRQGRWALPRPLVLGGRSAGARVAARLAGTWEADGVLALSFPLHPPARPERSRAEELRSPLRQGIPTLVVQGGRDRFGTPDQVRSAGADGMDGGGDLLRVHEVAGDHAPTPDLETLLEVCSAFLDGLPAPASD